MSASLKAPYANRSDQIARELRRLSIPGRLRGFSYLTYMLDRVIPDQNQLYLVTKGLYPDTGRHFGVSAGSVERNVRTAIFNGWKRGGQAALEEMACHPLAKPPTISEFLDIVASHIRHTN